MAGDPGYGLWILDIRQRPEHGAEDVGTGRVVAGAEAEADFLGHQIFHDAKTRHELGEQRRAGGGDEFVGFGALGDADAPGAEDRERGGCGHGKTTVRAADPAGALDHGRGKHARFAELLQGDGRTDDVDNGIHRADFVKVDLSRRQAVDFPLGVGDALEDRNGFLFHPRGQLAAQNQFFDIGKISLRVMSVFRLSMMRLR